MLGLSPAEKHRLERLYRRRIPPHQILTHDLSREMAELSHELNRRVGVLVDRAGRIEAVTVGEAKRVTVPRQPSAPAGRDRFCTLRFLSTRMGDEALSPADLAPIALHRLDALAVIAVNEDGLPGPVRVAHLLPAEDRGGEPASPSVPDDEAPRLPRGIVRAHGPNGRRAAPRKGSAVEDVVSDGERYRLFPRGRRACSTTTSSS